MLSPVNSGRDGCDSQMSMTIACLPLDKGLPANLLKLNNDFAENLSALDVGSAQLLLDQCFMAAHVGDNALLLALDQDAAYDNPNFRWFKERFDRFVYIDRVVVGDKMRGQGIGRALYGALFSRAAAKGHARVVCEINLHPPNPGSDAFHMAMGFEAIGQAYLPHRDKTVRYFVHPLTAFDSGA
jgi:predicted GNAT superfamily acetyltransferase